MSMRGQRIIVRPVYEDFKPMFEHKQDESSDILIVYVPGFVKEYLKVTIESRNTLRVRGERLVAGNKWSRFQEDYQIPEHSNTTGIRAKFEQGILTVTMPRKNKVIPQVQVVLPKTEPKEETIAKPIPENVSTAQVEKGKISDTKVNHNNVSNEEKSSLDNKQEALHSEPKVNDKIVTNIKERSHPIKSEELISEAKVPHKNVSNEESSGQDGIKKEKPITYEPKGSNEKLSPSDVQNRSGLENEDNKSTRNINGEILQRRLKEKNKNAHDIKNLSESKLDHLYNKAVIGKEEERQLLVNIGVAVLVIVALGAYAYYTQG